MHDRTPLAELLQQSMHERGYSLDRLARHAHVHKGTIHRWLTGAAAALQEAIGGAMVPGVRALYDQALLALRAQLGDTAFEIAFAQGRSMPLTEAIADALAQA